MKDATKIPRRIVDDITKGSLRLTDILVYFAATRFSAKENNGQFLCHIGESVGLDYRTVQTRLKKMAKLDYVIIGKGATVLFETPKGNYSAQTTTIRRVEPDSDFRFVHNNFFKICISPLFTRHELALFLFMRTIEFEDNTKGKTKVSNHRPTLYELRTKTRLHPDTLKATVKKMVSNRWIVKDGNGYRSNMAGIDRTIYDLENLNRPPIEVPPKSKPDTSSTSDYEERMFEQIRWNREREVKELQAAIQIPQRVLEVAE